MHSDLPVTAFCASYLQHPKLNVHDFAINQSNISIASLTVAGEEAEMDITS